MAQQRVNRAPDRSSKFAYKGRSFKTAKERSERRGGSWESIFKAGVDTWRPKEGDNQIRILPIPDSEHYAVQVWTHDRIGPDNSQFVCPRKMSNKPCAICDKAKDSREAGEVEEAKDLGVKEHWISWIIDREEDEETPKLYTMSITQDTTLVGLCLNNKNGSVLLIDHPDKGFDIQIKRVGKQINTKYIFSIDRESTSINEDKKVQQEILDYVSENPVEDLLIIRPSSYLKNAMIGSVEERDEDLDEEEDRPRKKRRGEEEVGEDEEIRQDRKSTKSKRQEEEDEEDPLPDEEEETRPMKRKKVRDEEEEESEEEEEEKPARSKKRAKDEEEEEETEEEEEERPRSKKKSRDEEEEETTEEEEEEERPRKKLGRR